MIFLVKAIIPVSQLCKTVSVGLCVLVELVCVEVPTAPLTLEEQHWALFPPMKEFTWDGVVEIDSEGVDGFCRYVNYSAEKVRFTQYVGKTQTC